MRTVQDNITAIIQFRETLLSDEVLYNAFLTSIEDVAKSIADRIIWEE